MGIIRKLSLKLLKATAFNTSIKHHFTNRNFFLNTYNHKGYWFYGKKREQETISVFQKWIEKDNYVLEIGGHIGYFTTFYADLVGAKGKVDVFEPSDTNLFYLNKNIENLSKELGEIITVVTKGAGDVNETLNFYIDPISGQNNSFVENFDGFINSRELSADKSVEIIVSKVDVITLDSYYETATRFPDFVKIDVEGFEWNVLQGFKNTIVKHHPKLMVEIQSDADAIIKFFKENGYTIYNDKLQEIVDYADYKNKKSPNIFFSYNK